MHVPKRTIAYVASTAVAIFLIQTVLNMLALAFAKVILRIIGI